MKKSDSRMRGVSLKTLVVEALKLVGKTLRDDLRPLIIYLENVWITISRGLIKSELSEYYGIYVYIDLRRRVAYFRASIEEDTCLT